MENSGAMITCLTAPALQAAAETPLRAAALQAALPRAAGVPTAVKQLPAVKLHPAPRNTTTRTRMITMIRMTLQTMPGAWISTVGMRRTIIGRTIDIGTK